MASRPSSEFVKQSKGGVISLRLKDQERDATLPVYGCGGIIGGTVELSKTDNVIAVEVKVSTVLEFSEAGRSYQLRLKAVCTSKKSQRVEQRRINCACRV